MYTRVELTKRIPILALIILAALGVALIFLIVRSPLRPRLVTASPAPSVTAPPTVLSPAIQSTAHPTSIWSALLAQTPYPHTTPLPDPSRSPVDGTYAKFDPSWPQWWACLRCADYRPAGGIWKLQFDQGVMRIYYDVTGWRSLASFTVSGDRLHVFNDPYCPQDAGEYAWSLADGSLELEVVDDPCSINLRGENLSQQPWLACEPPDAATAASDDWDKPPGCEERPAFLPTAIPPDLDVTVVIHRGDARKYSKPPDVYAVANSADLPPPKGIQVTYSDDSIPYGLNRILWQEGDWVQATTDAAFAAMGVQFYGDYIIGWARVLFDGVEVWRGDTSAIWSDLGQHGGYVEISGFGPGTHTIRAERLAVDSRPVRVLYFGFSNEAGVKSQATAGEPGNPADSVRVAGARQFCARLRY